MAEDMTAEISEETPAKKPSKKAAKKPASKNTPKKAVKSEEAAPKPKKPAKKKAASKVEAIKIENFVHNETKFSHLASISPTSDAIENMKALVDQVNGNGRIRITSLAVAETNISLHAVSTDHTDDKIPGIVLQIDTLTNLVNFDHVTLGMYTPYLVEDGAFALLEAIKGDDENPANEIGRRRDWLEQAVFIAEDVADRYASA